MRGRRHPSSRAIRARSTQSGIIKSRSHIASQSGNTLITIHNTVARIRFMITPCVGHDRANCRRRFVAGALIGLLPNLHRALTPGSAITPRNQPLVRYPDVSHFVASTRLSLDTSHHRCLWSHPSLRDAYPLVIAVSSNAVRCHVCCLLTHEWHFVRSQDLFGLAAVGAATAHYSNRPNPW